MAGEMLPLIMVRSTKVQNLSNYHVQKAWVEGLPTITGLYGFDEPKNLGRYNCFTPSSSVDEEVFEIILDVVIYPLFPNMGLKVPAIFIADAGPGTLVLSLQNKEMQHNACEQGLFIHPGLPNSISVT